MAFPNPLRTLSGLNHADNAVITGNAAVETLPLSNLKTDDIQQLWRSASTNTQQAIIADLGALRAISVVMLINSNVLAPSTWHVRISTADPTGLDGDAYEAIDIPGIPEPAYNRFVHFIEPAVSGRYVRITMNNLTVIPEAGRLVIADTWAPTHDMQFGFEPLWRDLSTRSTSLGGNEFVDVRFRQRGWRFRIVGLTATEAADEVDEINRVRGIGRDILVCRDKNSGNLGRDTMWGLLAEPVRQQRTEIGYEIDVEVWDRV